MLRVPCLTPRDSTERPETVDVGANVVAGTDQETVVKLAKETVRRNKNWKNPYGTEKAAKRIVEHSGGVVMAMATTTLCV